jgi:hypothetical protein
MNEGYKTMYILNEPEVKGDEGEWGWKRFGGRIGVGK